MRSPNDQDYSDLEMFSGTGSWTQWQIEDLGDDRYRLINREFGKFIRPFTNNEGSLVGQYPTSYTGNWTMWRFIEVEPPATILREVWTNVSGYTIASLTNDPRFPDSPTSSNQMTSFEAPVNWADNYGTRVRGFIHPPTTGSYTFWIASDNHGELWLSTNETVAGASQIALVWGYTSSRQWTKYPEQQSAAISLVGGQKYYIEALHKEQDQGDNLAVAWSGPGISGPVVIDGQYLSPWTGGSDGAKKSATATVAINDKDFKDLLIYPNPFDSYINITLQEKAQLNLYDISGKIRLTMKLEEGLNTIPTAYLEKGIYMMKISGNERVFNKLMVK